MNPESKLESVKKFIDTELAREEAAHLEKQQGAEERAVWMAFVVFLAFVITMAAVLVVLIYVGRGP